MVALWAALLALGGPPASPDVVVMAPPPINVERLADSLRAYLLDYGIRVETASPSASGDLRGQLSEVRRTGEVARAAAVVLAENRSPGLIEIELVDLATDKVLLAEIPRPPRDEDLYRALALKIQALLRSTLSEAPSRLAVGSGIARLAEPERSLAAAEVGATPPRLALETGYAAVSFPLGGLFLQGGWVAARFNARAWLDLGLGVAVLGSTHTTEGEFGVDTTVLPVVAAARFRRTGARYELLAGPCVELALARVTTSSSSRPGLASRDPIFAVGGELEGRFRAGSSVWFYLRTSALGVVAGPYYVVEGHTVVDGSRLQVGGVAGFGVGMP
jgi:hypothetical protein